MTTHLLPGDAGAPASAPHGSMFSLLRGNRDFAAYVASTFLSSLAAEILTVAIGWKIYELSGSALDLGLVGLVQFLPSCLLVFFTGAAADLYPRRTIILCCLVCELLFTLGIFVFAGGIPGMDLQAVWPILLLVGGLAVGRAFLSPAAQAIAPNLVRREEISGRSLVRPLPGSRASSPVPPSVAYSTG